ncbi:hypothetical protein D9611_011598 [Ephemerocybe angulata]|uniref:F-box domain-containing protein n=1 Tax=Ephemerocybe angulata TaxID=980116 RepID=A0A8H5ET50_9AGAR|nr:hypothetical protein D9611_011598 [Tulosesus angulatus]
MQSSLLTQVPLFRHHPPGEKMPDGSIKIKGIEVLALLHDSIVPTVWNAPTNTSTEGANIVEEVDLRDPFFPNGAVSALVCTNPSSTASLPYAYRVYMDPCHVIPPHNRCIEKVFKKPWMGNVVVVRYARNYTLEPTKPCVHIIMAFPPAFASLLTSNDPPDELNAAHLVEIAASLSVAIDEALEKVQVLEQELKKCRTVLSPARKVPQEILSEIFSLVPLVDGKEEDPADVTVVSLVSRAWREAALNTHSLWQGLVFSPCRCVASGDKGSHYHETEYEKARSWLSRSGALPKTVRLERTPDGTRCMCEDPRRRCESTHPTVVKLLTEGPPIDEFTLHVTSTSCFRKWMASVTSAGQKLTRCTRWAKLRCFSLVFHDIDRQLWDDTTDPNLSIFANLPPVTEFHLNLPSMERAFDDEDDALSCSLHIPVPFLNGLSIFVIRWEWGGSRLAELLVHCINLESFTLDLDETEVFNSSDDPVTLALRVSPIDLGNLKALHIRRGNIHILEVLKTPSLHTLDIEFSVPLPQTWDAVLRVGRFITESKIESTLQTLRLCELLAAQSSVYLPLPALPALRHLDLDSTGVAGYHFAVKGWFDDGSKKHPQFPSLAHLEILNLQRSSRTLQKEVSYLQRRREGVPCMITASYRDDVVYTEGTLQSELLSGKDVFLRLVQNEEYDDSRSCPPRPTLLEFEHPTTRAQRRRQARTAVPRTSSSQYPTPERLPSIARTSSLPGSCFFGICHGITFVRYVDAAQSLGVLEEDDEFEELATAGASFLLSS